MFIECGQWLNRQMAVATHSWSHQEVNLIHLDELELPYISLSSFECWYTALYTCAQAEDTLAYTKGVLILPDCLVTKPSSVLKLQLRCTCMALGCVALHSAME